MMKQVVGGVFCGFFNQPVEDKIVDRLLEESLQLVESGFSVAEKKSRMDQSLSRVMALLKGYLAPRIEVYLGSIMARLLDPELNPRWCFRNNNYQTFCDNIIDRPVYGPMFAPRGAISIRAERMQHRTPRQTRRILCIS